MKNVNTFRLSLYVIFVFVPVLLYFLFPSIIQKAGLDTYIIVSVLWILFIFYFLWQLSDVAWRFNRVFKNKNDLKSIEDTIKKYDEYRLLSDGYYSKFTEVDGKRRCPLYAEMIFTPENIFDRLRINVKSLQAAAGILVGIGMIGTFWGLVAGVYDFKAGNSNEIRNSVNSLLGGMGTAFITSIVGMGLSTIFIFIEKWVFKSFERCLNTICYLLNNHYYISETEIITANFRMDTKRQIDSLSKNVSERFLDLGEKISSAITDNLSYCDDSGRRVSLANASRDAFMDLHNQAGEIATLVDDFSDKLDDRLEKNVNDNIAPMMKQNIAIVGQQINKLAESVVKPAMTMNRQVIDSVNEHMGQLVTNFGEIVLTTVKKDFDLFSENMLSASEAIVDVPKMMENVTTHIDEASESLNIVIDSIRISSDEMLEKSKSVNEEIVSLARSEFETVDRSREEVSQRIVKKISAAADDIVEKGVETNSLIMENVREEFERIKSENERVNEANRQFVDTVMEEAGKKLEEITSAVNESVAGIPLVMESVNEKLRETVSELDSVSSTLNQSSKDLGLNISREVSAAADKIVDKGIEANSLIMDNVREEFERIKSENERVNEANRLFVDTVMEQAGKKLGEITSAVNESVAGIPLVMESVNEKLGETVSELDSVSTTLDQSSKDLGLNISREVSAAAEDIAQKGIETNSLIMENVKAEFARLSEQMANVAEVNSKYVVEVLSAAEDKLADVTQSHADINERTAELMGKFTDTITQVAVASEEVGICVKNIAETKNDFEIMTSRMRESMVELGKVSGDFARTHEGQQKHIAEIERMNNELVSNVRLAIENSGKNLQSYSEKFSTVEKGLVEIFEKIQRGLKQYGTTMSEQSKNVIVSYTDSLTEGVNTLQQTVSMMHDSMVEFGRLLETSEKKRRK